MIDDAIFELYKNVKQVEIKADGSIIVRDIDKNEVSIDMNAVNTKASELQAEADAQAQAKEDLKAMQKLNL